MLRNLDKNDIKVIKLSILIGLILCLFSFVLSFIIRWWKCSWVLSILIGDFTSIICYIKIVHVTTNMTNFVYLNPKRVLILNNLTNYLLYLIALVISVLLKVFNIFLCFMGIMIIKIVIYIKYSKISNKKEE